MILKDWRQSGQPLKEGCLSEQVGLVAHLRVDLMEYRRREWVLGKTLLRFAPP